MTICSLSVTHPCCPLRILATHPHSKIIPYQNMYTLQFRSVGTPVDLIVGTRGSRSCRAKRRVR